MVRKGARLTLRYDASTNAFTGTVENTTSATLAQVRVEIHRVTGLSSYPRRTYLLHQASVWMSG